MHIQGKERQDQNKTNINVICPVTSLTHSSMALSPILSKELGIINNVHPLLLLPRKKSKHILSSPDVLFSLTNEEANLISISYLIASAASQGSRDTSRDNNHYRKSDFLILTSQLTREFIISSGWGKLENSSILSAGEILFSYLNTPAIGKTKSLKAYLPERINLSDSNIKNVPSIVVNALKERSNKVETIVRENEERLITSLLESRDKKLVSDSKLRESLPLRAINFVVDLLKELDLKIPKQTLDFYSSILESPTLPVETTVKDLENFITILDATDSTASVKFLALNILDKKLSKLSNTNFLLSLGFEDENETKTSSKGISNQQLTSFLDELSNVRKKKPEFELDSTAIEGEDGDMFDSLFSSQNSPNQSKETNQTKQKDPKEEIPLLDRIKALQSSIKIKRGN